MRLALFRNDIKNIEADLLAFATFEDKLSEARVLLELDQILGGLLCKLAEEEGNTAAQKSFEFAMKAEEVHAKLYQEALDSLDQEEEVFYYLCPVCGNIEKSVPEKCPICGVQGEKFIKY